MELQGPLWAPKRLFPNLITLAFVLIVPILYGAIYSFRRKHATTMLGLCAIKFQHVAFLAIDSVVCSKFANLHQNKQIEGILFA